MLGLMTLQIFLKDVLSILLLFWYFIFYIPSSEKSEIVSGSESGVSVFGIVSSIENVHSV